MKYIILSDGAVISSEDLSYIHFYFNGEATLYYKDDTEIDISNKEDVLRIKYIFNRTLLMSK